MADTQHKETRDASHHSGKKVHRWRRRSKHRIHVAHSQQHAPHINHTRFDNLSPEAKDRVQKVVEAARKVHGDNETLARVAAAQALLESGVSRTSLLASEAHNLFGIKRTENEPFIKLNTYEFTKGGKKYQTKAEFARFDSFQDSFRKHKDFLYDKDHNFEKVIAASTFVAAVKALQKARYATSPTYAKDLMNIHRNYVDPIMSATAPKVPAQNIKDIQTIAANNPRYSDLVTGMTANPFPPSPTTAEQDILGTGLYKPTMPNYKAGITGGAEIPALAQNTDVKRTPTQVASNGFKAPRASLNL